MAKKISELTALTDVATTDIIPINDVSASATKKITTKDLTKVSYPIGSLYYSVNSTNPGTLLGGTWTEIDTHEIVESGDITSSSLQYCKYRIFADGTFEVEGVANGHDIAGLSNNILTITFPYTISAVVCVPSLAYGNANFASVQSYCYGSGTTIYLLSYNESSGTASAIQESFIGKGTLDLEANNIDTIHCFKRTA